MGQPEPEAAGERSAGVGRGCARGRGVALTRWMVCSQRGTRDELHKPVSSAHVAGSFEVDTLGLMDEGVLSHGRDVSATQSRRGAADGCPIPHMEIIGDVRLPLIYSAYGTVGLSYTHGAVRDVDEPALTRRSFSPIQHPLDEPQRLVALSHKSASVNSSPEPTRTLAR